jgi:DNA-binding LacI/PurR family transcriptional regulator
MRPETEEVYCQEHDISVPKRVAIAGSENLPESQVASPSLTTVAYPVESMARLALQCLIEDRTSDLSLRPNRNVFLEAHLIIRGSTDPSSRTLELTPVTGDEVYEPLYKSLKAT